jgi:iron complex outermembrane receptor protein
LELEWAPSGSGIESVDAQVYSNRKDHRMNNDEKPTAQPMPGRMPPFGIDVVLPAESDTSGGRLRVVGGRNELTWTAGLDGYFLDQTATRSIFRRDNGVLLFRDIVWPDAEIDDVGGYLQLARHRTRATWVATVRGDRVDVRAGTASEFFLATSGGDLDDSETNLSAAVSGRIRVDPAWTVTLGLGRAVRTATALERYSDRFPSTRFQIAAEFVGDPGIDPEASLQLDLGADYQTARLFFQVSAFLRRIGDYITVEPAPDLGKRLPLSPNLVYRYVNGDEARFSGGEVQLRHRATDRVEWRASASYVRGEDTLFGEPAFGVPPLTGRLGLRLSPRSDLWLDANLTVADRQDRVAASRLEQPTPGYTVLDLLASYEPTTSWRLLLGVDNLGDRQYVNHLNTLDPFTGRRIAEQGRNVHAAVEYSF